MNSLPNPEHPELMRPIFFSVDTGPGLKVPFPFTIGEEAMQELISRGLHLDHYVKDNDLAGLLKTTVENSIQNIGSAEPHSLLEQIGIQPYHEEYGASLIFMQSYATLIANSSLTIDEIRGDIRPQDSFVLDLAAAGINGLLTFNSVMYLSRNPLIGAACGIAAATVSLAVDPNYSFTALPYVAVAVASLAIGNQMDTSPESTGSARICLMQTVQMMPYIDMKLRQLGAPFENGGRLQKYEELSQLNDLVANSIVPELNRL